MNRSASPVPDGYHTVTPYLIVRDAVAAIDFYGRAFGATEKLRLQSPEGKIGHAEVVIGNSHVMLADEFPEMNIRGPASLGGTSVSLLIYVPNVDEVFQQAIDAGGTAVRPVQDQFYGDRSGQLVDPFGHFWSIATHTDDLPQEEVERRYEELMKTPPA
jgi:PhnB protein